MVNGVRSIDTAKLLAALALSLSSTAHAAIGWEVKFAVIVGASLISKHAYDSDATLVVTSDTAKALFAGDSITFRWSQASAEKNTGISGATAEAIGARFASEIQNGQPRYVHILAGTNNIFGLGKWDSSTVAAVSSMVDAARARNIPVIVGTIPPLDEARWPTLAAQVAPYNAALVASVKPKGAFIADYFSAMTLPGGLQNPVLFSDGVHPNEAGYEVMNHVLRQTRREMWRATTTPEQRAAWKERRAKK